MYVILVYDIKTTETSSRVTNGVFKVCKKFLTHVQNSVFEGDLSPVQCADLKIQLKKYLRASEDSCIMFKSNNEKWLQKEFLTEEDDKTTNLL
ncbi:MAG: CRISPR-associated endonuclease Cas2 [Clostridiaceae bacterium]|nr:CRISPR-associated endonuclease Cas2 [Clostridiaceae bacterium]